MYGQVEYQNTCPLCSEDIHPAIESHGIVEDASGEQFAAHVECVKVLAEKLSA